MGMPNSNHQCVAERKTVLKWVLQTEWTAPMSGNWLCGVWNDEGCGLVEPSPDTWRKLVKQVFSQNYGLHKIWGRGIGNPMEGREMEAYK